jgi:hypothetical protein
VCVCVCVCVCAYLKSESSGLTLADANRRSSKSTIAADDARRLKRLSKRVGSIFALARSSSKSQAPELLSHDKAGLLVAKPQDQEEDPEIAAYRTVRFATNDSFMYHIQTFTTVVCSRSPSLSLLLFHVLSHVF